MKLSIFTGLSTVCTPSVLWVAPYCVSFLDTYSFQDLSGDLFGKICQLAETHGEEFSGHGESGDTQSSSKKTQSIMGKGQFWELPGTDHFDYPI